jgi:hypothetical protein
MSQKLRFDEIGTWSRIKIEIIKKYAAAYARILGNNPRLRFAYIDAFAGPGQHRSKTSGEIIMGTSRVVLNITPKFHMYYFVDIVPEKIDYLKKQVGDRPDVEYFVGDSNEVLLKEVFAHIGYQDYKRALCVLDPYGLHLDWKVIQAAGDARSIEIFLNFPVADMNRNVFWRNPEGVDPSDIARMDRFWPDPTWRYVAYTTETDLFKHPERTDNETVARAFAERLRDTAGFPHVPEPLPMKNTQGAVVYYLMFASHNSNGAKIADDIFKKYRKGIN